MQRLHVSVGSSAFETETTREPGSTLVDVQLKAAEGEEQRRVRVLRSGPEPLVLVNDRVLSLRMATGAESRESSVWFETGWRRVLRGASGASTQRGAAAQNDVLSSPMPGRVVAVRVQPGDEVQTGQLLLVIEAMKMQNELYSPAACRVESVLVSPGDAVERGAPLLRFA
ncbi:MAG: acetyl-CoA carboxylase biotin carboxyl carrier protein subunit [Myxococcota bacterium]